MGCTTTSEKSKISTQINIALLLNLKKFISTWDWHDKNAKYNYMTQ